MKISKSGLDIIKKYEGCKLDAYLCPANIPTIGYGSTLYEDGTKVKLGDKITQERAESLLMNTLSTYEQCVTKSVKTVITQTMFDALVSFTYNLGCGSLQSSTLLKKVNMNRYDPTIKDEFNKWVKGGGKVLPGLVKRREDEAKLYFL